MTDGNFGNTVFTMQDLSRDNVTLPKNSFVMVPESSLTSQASILTAVVVILVVILLLLLGMCLLQLRRECGSKSPTSVEGTNVSKGDWGAAGPPPPGPKGEPEVIP